MLTPPPLKDKPPNPLPVLPVPKRKEVAFLIVAIPILVGMGLGWLCSVVIAWAIPFVPSASIQRVLEIVGPWLPMTVGSILGTFIGIRTLTAVLLYGAASLNDKRKNG